MNEIQSLLKSIRGVSKANPVTYMQLSEIIRRLWRPRPKVYSVFQEAHGFVVGNVIKPADPIWVKAKADTEVNAKATAVVCEIINTDNFLYLQEGLVTGDYTIGAKYLLSITTAGAVFVQSDPEVWTPGNFRQMIGTGTADGLLVEIDEGAVIKPDSTPHIGENGNWYIGTTDTGIAATGQGGDPGRGIVSVTLTNTVGLVKTYTITFTDATTTTFEVTDGADGTGGGSDTFMVHLIFDAAGAITYPCPYALKFTAMIHQQTNAPTLSIALNTDMAQYDNLDVTADAAGLVTLTGSWL